MEFLDEETVTIDQSGDLPDQAGVDGQGGAEENEVRTGVLPLPVLELDERQAAFEHPAQSEACHHPGELLPRGHEFEEEKKAVHEDC